MVDILICHPQNKINSYLGKFSIHRNQYMYNFPPGRLQNPIHGHLVLKDTRRSQDKLTWYPMLPMKHNLQRIYSPEYTKRPKNIELIPKVTHRKPIHSYFPLQITHIVKATLFWTSRPPI